MERKTELYAKVTFLVKSLAGHDKGRIYAAIGEDETGYELVNGIHATYGKPKYKKKIHVQVIKKLSIEITDLLGNAINDQEVSEAITLYEHRI